MYCLVAYLSFWSSVFCDGAKDMLHTACRVVSACVGANRVLRGAMGVGRIYEEAFVLFFIMSCIAWLYACHDCLVYQALDDAFIYVLFQRVLLCGLGCHVLCFVFSY